MEKKRPHGSTATRIDDGSIGLAVTAERGYPRSRFSQLAALGELGRGLSLNVTKPMVEKLYILRHGIALPHGTPGIADDDRPLTPKGEVRIREISRALGKLDLKIERIVTSPLPRARRTAELVAGTLRLIDELENSDVLRPGTPLPSIRDWLREFEVKRLMIVGHNPTLSDLIGFLALDHPNAMLGDLKKGGIAAMANTGGTGERFEIDWIATPRLLRKLV